MSYKYFIFLIVFLVGMILPPISKGQTITLSSPVSSGTYSDSFTFALGISGEVAGTISNVRLVFKCTSSPYPENVNKVDSVTMVSTLLSQTFNVNLTTLKSSTLFSNASSNLTDGVYTIYAQYTRSTGAIVKSNLATSVKYDGVALPITLKSPAANTTYKGTFAYADSLTELYASGSRILTLQNTSTGVTNRILFKNSYSKISFDFNSKNISSSYIDSISSTSLPDGKYYLLMSYKDMYNHTATLNRFFSIDSKTTPPELISPANSVRQNSQLDLYANFPESILANSAKLIFQKIGGGTDSLVLANPTQDINKISLNLKNLTSSNIASTSTTSLSDGTYNIILKYSDFMDNAFASDTIYNFVLDNLTLAPSLTSPSSNQVLRSGDPINLSFTLPEKPQAGSLKLNIFDDATNYSISLNGNVGSNSYTIDPQNIYAATGVLSSPSNQLKNGRYTLSVSYQDSLGNSVASTLPQSILLDTETLPFTSLSLPDSTSADGFMDLNFNIPEDALANTVKLYLNGCDKISMDLQATSKGSHTIRINGSNLVKNSKISNSTKSTIPNGNYAVILNYQDTLGNQKSEAIKTNLLVRGTIPPPVITTKIYNPLCNDTLAVLSDAITSDTSAYTMSYYSDSTTTNRITRPVSVAGTYYVKATNVQDLDTVERIVVSAFTICPEGLNSKGNKTRDRNRYIDKNGRIGNFRTMDKHGKIISIPH